MRIGLFVPCYIDAFFPAVGIATLELLERINTVAYLSQPLNVLLDPADIDINLHHAYRRPEFRNRHYAAFHTGPSATADIEGVLIHGAQGVQRAPAQVGLAVAFAWTTGDNISTVCSA